MHVRVRDWRDSKGIVPDSWIYKLHRSMCIKNMQNNKIQDTANVVINKSMHKSALGNRRKKGKGDFVCICWFMYLFNFFLFSWLSAFSNSVLYALLAGHHQAFYKLSPRRAGIVPVCLIISPSQKNG